MCAAKSVCLLLVALSVASQALTQELPSRFETFDRYDPTQYAVEVEGLEGEHIDMRTLAVSWEVTDYVLPGNGGLDIRISRSFNKLSHTPSDMGHWYFGVPRIQIPTSPWRAPYDPSYASIGTFPAAWYNLYARLGNGATSICEGAGNLIDQSVRASLTGILRGGILYAAPITLYIPGEGAKVLLETAGGQGQYPGLARYVTTDNWWARCLPPTQSRIWGGFEVVSPAGLRYVFDFIQYMVPGDYATGSTGGWVEMGISRIYDHHGNSIDYVYDLDAGGTDLLTAIEASDGRMVTLDYYPGSLLGVDVQGSPLSLISSVNIHADGQIHAIEYDYCDFADYYLLQIGCRPIDLGPDKGLPVLHAVRTPDGQRTQYRYHPSVYAANILLDWGNFEFQLASVTLPTGGTVEYSYDPGFHVVLANTDTPAPRVSRRITRGRGVAEGRWDYAYTYANHLETTTVTGPQRQDVYEFYEGLGTYEFRIARYPGQHHWPDTAPTDYDELLGLLKERRSHPRDGSGPLRRTRYEHALLPVIGRQFYSGNWLGWPTLVLAQIRQRPVRERRISDYTGGTEPVDYRTWTDGADFDIYGYPLVVHESGVDPLSPDGGAYRRTDFSWAHDVSGWFIGLPGTQTLAGYTVEHDYVIGDGLLSRVSDGHVTTTYEYDAGGNLRAEIWQRDGVEHRREFGDYHRGHYRYRSDPVDPAGGETLVTHRGVNDLGQITWREDGAGQRTSFVSDFSGRPLVVDQPATLPVTYAYGVDSEGDWHEVRQTQGERARVLALDGFGRALSLTDEAEGEQRARSWQYDAAGRLIFESFPAATVAASHADGHWYTYDEFSRPVSARRGLDAIARTWCYRLDCVPPDYTQRAPAPLNGYVLTDENGFRGGFDFAAVGKPEAGRLAVVIEEIERDGPAAQPEFRVTNMLRNAHGDLIRLSQGAIDGTQVERSFVYEGRRLLEEHHPETGITIHAYDERGNRVSTLFDEANFVTYEYDGLDRLIRTDYPGEADDVDFAYGPAGELRHVINPHSVRLYAYDSAQRLTRESVSVDNLQVEFNYAYNAAGHLESILFPSGEIVDYAPDGFGRPTRAGALIESASYWPNGSLRSMRYGNAIDADFELNAQQRAGALRYARDSGVVLTDLAYSYDAIGNLSAIADQRSPPLSLALDYDGLSRLVAATGYWGRSEFVYDATDNLRERSGAGSQLALSFAADNLPDSVNDGGSPQPITHDDRGNLTAVGSFGFEFNAAAQLTGVSHLPDIEYRYDGHGRRIVSEDDAGRRYSIFDRSGALLYVDNCERGGRVSEFVYLSGELVGRMDSDCAQGCHP